MPSAIAKSLTELNQDPLSIDQLDRLPSAATDRQVLRIAAIAELDAINLYERLATRASDSNVVNILIDVANEEKTHVGEFNELLAMIDEQHRSRFNEGVQEARNSSTNG